MIVSPAGFLCWDDTDPPEIVLWIHDGENVLEPMAEVEKMLGPDHGARLIEETPRTSERVVPGTEPMEFKPAAAFFLEIDRRIPTPTVHAGCEQRYSRVRGEHVLISPAVHPRDGYDFNFPN
tara:strand:- start:5453 stop:5818 length:366 start_codon:yes stop_codon:yes gene_type:complete